MSFTKEFIKDKLANDVRWMERGVLVLYERQTADEQKVKDTRENNGVGFTGVDGRYMSWVATWLQKGNHLTGRHIEKVGKKLPKYWKQIKEIIEEKQGG
jgi:hypothetical protein